MTVNFNFETFRAKAKSILEHKNLVTTSDYIDQMENLLQELLPGHGQGNDFPGNTELNKYLEKVKSRINGLFYNTSIAYCILNEKGVVVSANKAFYSLFELDQATVDGQDIRSHLHPDSIELFDFQINKILTTKTTVSTNLRFLQADKEIIIRFQTSYFNEDEQDYLQCMATDISGNQAVENELASGEVQFRNLLEATPAGIIVLHDEKCIYCNKAGASFLEYDQPDELIGKPVFESINGENENSASGQAPIHAESVQGKLKESLVLRRNGKSKNCQTVSMPVVFNNRLSTLVLIKEISVPEKNEKQLDGNDRNYKEMYHLLRMMCDNVQDMIWAKNLNNEYIFVNKAISEGLLNATDTNEPVGKTDMFFAERERRNHPENTDYHTFGEICHDTDITVIHNKKAHRFNEYGNVKGKFIYLDVFKAPFFDSEGNIIGTVGSGRDVTNERWLQDEHTKTMKALTSQTARLDAVVSALPDLMFIIDTNGNFLDFFTTDPAKLFVAPDHIKNLNLSQLFNPEEVERQLEIYRRCIETRSVLSFEYNLVANNETLSYEARTAALGENTILAIVRDITEKKKTELQLKMYTSELIAAKEKAETSDQLKSAFLANMSHEIRTPMNSIMGFADLLNDPDIDVEKRREYTDIIINRSADLLQIINDVLDISRIESGNASLHNRVCDLNKLLDKLHAVFTSRLQLKPGSRVRLVCEKAIKIGRFSFQVDELKLKQIFTNLLDNALKFTDQGTIRFGYSLPVNNTITCFVSDTGIGIAPQFTDVIFERFRQADIPNRYKYKGTGLGLAICKGNAELMGGNIRVESEPGKGSHFIFDLPFIQVMEDGSKNIAQKLISGFNWQDKKIIIVEDDEQNIQYLQTILRKTGINIFIAHDGSTFRQLLTQIPDIEIILMDIQLPDEDGWQLTQYTKLVNRNIPVIAQTAFGTESDRLKSIESGCDNFLAKPIAPDELLNMIALYLEK